MTDASPPPEPVFIVVFVCKNFNLVSALYDNLSAKITVHTHTFTGESKKEEYVAEGIQLDESRREIGIPNIPRMKVKANWTEKMKFICSFMYLYGTLFTHRLYTQEQERKKERERTTE